MQAPLDRLLALFDMYSNGSIAKGWENSPFATEARGISGLIGPYFQSVNAAANAIPHGFDAAFYNRAVQGINAQNAQKVRQQQSQALQAGTGGGGTNLGIAQLGANNSSDVLANLFNNLHGQVPQQEQQRASIYASGLEPRLLGGLSPLLGMAGQQGNAIGQWKQNASAANLGLLGSLGGALGNIFAPGIGSLAGMGGGGSQRYGSFSPWGMGNPASGWQSGGYKSNQFMPWMLGSMGNAIGGGFGWL